MPENAEFPNLKPVFALNDDVTPVVPRGEFKRAEWLLLDDLRINTKYARKMTKTVIRFVEKIREDFDWDLFKPLDVTPRGDAFEIVDGQLRAVAAREIGLNALPCVVRERNEKQAALAYLLLNRNAKRLNAVDIWYASIEAEEPATLELKEVLAAIGVTFVHKKRGYNVGETRAVMAMIRAHNKYGSDFLSLVLRCVMESRGGAPGLINGAMVKGVGEALRGSLGRPFITDAERTVSIFKNVSLTDWYSDASVESRRCSRGFTDNSS